MLTQKFTQAFTNPCLDLEEGLHQKQPHYEAAYSVAVADVTFELEEAEQCWQMRAHLVLMLLSQKTLK